MQTLFNSRLLVHFLITIFLMNIAFLAYAPTASAAAMFGQTTVGVVPATNVPFVKTTTNQDDQDGVKVQRTCGGNVFVGGKFDQVTSAGVTTNRQAFFSYNKQTGALTGLNLGITNTDPTTANNVLVNSMYLDPSCTTLYIGGNFDPLFSGGSESIAKFNLSSNGTAAVLDRTFNPRPVRQREPATGQLNRVSVYHLDAYQGRLIVAGNFYDIGVIHAANAQQTALAALDPGSGNDTRFIVQQFRGTRNLPGGNIPTQDTNDNDLARDYRTSVTNFSISNALVADSTAGIGAATNHLVAVGNFGTVDTVNRGQAVMLALRSTSAPTSNWNSKYFMPDLNGLTRMTNWLRGINFSADGQYMCMASTGGHHYFDIATSTADSKLYDSISRWDMKSIGSGQASPTWINSMGADSAYSCVISDTAGVVYAGGHFRYLDNTPTKNAAGQEVCGMEDANSEAIPCPGAVFTDGVGAIDTTTGRAIDWAPNRERKHGAVDLFLDGSGLYISGDSDSIGCSLPAKGQSCMNVSNTDRMDPGSAMFLPYDVNVSNYTGTQCPANTAYACISYRMEMLRNASGNYYGRTSVYVASGQTGKIQPLRTQIDNLNLVTGPNHDLVGSTSGVNKQLPKVTGTTSAVSVATPTALQEQVFFSVRYTNGGLYSFKSGFLNYGTGI